MPKPACTSLVIFFLLVLLCSAGTTAFAQDSMLTQLPSSYLSKVSERTNDIKIRLDKASEKALSALQKQESKIHRRLLRIDSSKARQLFSATDEKYNNIKQKLQQPQAFRGYISSLDTLQSSLKFIQNNPELINHVKSVEGQLQDAVTKVKSLEASLESAEQLKAFIKERKDYLKDQVEGLPFAGALKKLNKQAYYYNQQVNEYREMIRDPSKIERKALELLSKTKAFQEFMQKHSQLASLFRMPGTDDASEISLQGLQTRSQIEVLLQERFGSGPEAAQLLQQNVQGAQGQLSSLKERVARYGEGAVRSGTSDTEMPDFKPNDQKTKSLFKRLEWGSNIQSQRARAFFPVTSDLGLSMGYKLNDKSVVGVGAAYKLGWGSGWNNIRISHQGVGLRSFIDYKLKGSFYISGGYEMNYRSLINHVDQLRDYSAWQSSGLVGISKKYSVSKKLKGSMQLLWDFLSYQQVPRTQAVIWRLSYSLK